MLYQPYPTTAATKEKLIQEAKATVRFLSRSAAILGSKRFHRYVESDESRLPWVTERLYQRLRKDLVFQLNQGLEGRLDDLKAMPISDLLTAWSEKALLEVERLEKGHDLSLTKKEKAFKVSSGERFEDKLYEVFSSENKGPFVKDMNRPFYLWNALDAIAVFVRAKRTLTVDTGNKAFERFLYQLTEDYMLAGYPHDILAHDADAIRSKGTVHGILARKEYCSTWALPDKNDMPANLDGFDVIKLNVA